MSATVETGSPTRSARPRMYHVDLLRVLTFTCVVFVHSYGAMQPASSVDMGATSLLMHFTRYSFVFITAFVLFHGYYRKNTPATTFYRRRFGAVLLPYVVWSLIYTVVVFTTIDPPTGAGDGAWTVVYNLLTGQAWFHLYFLLVSMQLYLFFPLLRWLVRKTTGHHGLLLAGAAVVQVGMMLLFSHVPAPHGALGTQMWKLADAEIWTYALFVIVGALFALHLDRVGAILSDNRWLGALAFALGLTLTLFAYFRHVASGVDPAAAGSPIDVDVLPWALGSIVGLYTFCLWWSSRRVPGTVMARVVDWGSIRAFGVYAVHPFLVNLQWAPMHQQWLDLFGNRVAAGLAMFLTTVVLSVLAVELMLRTPWAKALVARSPLRQKPAASDPTTLPPPAR